MKKKKKAAPAPAAPTSFATLAEYEAWLADHHATATELWVRMFKKGSGTPSIDWPLLVEGALAWGWIDGVRKTYDDKSFIQRVTPRRKTSSWSKKNCDIAERLIAEGRMQPAGLAHVELAKKDGRWDRAYVGASQMEIPADFLAALDENAAARAFYASLNRTNLFTIYHRLQTAKRPETRARRMAAMIEQLAAKKPFH